MKLSEKGKDALWGTMAVLCIGLLGVFVYAWGSSLWHAILLPIVLLLLLILGKKRFDRRDKGSIRIFGRELK